MIAIGLVTLIAFFNIPLRFADGTELAVPAMFEFGFWLSIVIGILFLALYSRRVATEIRTMSDALLATQMALAREQKLTDLGEWWPLPRMSWAPRWPRSSLPVPSWWKSWGTGPSCRRMRG